MAIDHKTFSDAVATLTGTRSYLWSVRRKTIYTPGGRKPVGKVLELRNPL